MVVYEINDIVASLIDFEYDGLVFPLAGVSGTIINRIVTEYTAEGEDDIYNYQVSYPSSIEGINVETNETASMRSFWLTSEDLGIATISTLDTSAEIAASANNLSSAQTAANTAENVVVALLPTIGSSNRKDSINRYLTAIQSAKTALTDTSIDYSTTDTTENTAYNATVQSDYVGNDTVFLQEASENLAQIQAVVDEVKAELQTFSQQAEEQAARGRSATEEDSSAYINTYAISTLDPRIPTDVEENDLSFPDLDLDQLEASAESAYLLPELEEKTIFVDRD